MIAQLVKALSSGNHAGAWGRPSSPMTEVPCLGGGLCQVGAKRLLFVQIGVFVFPRVGGKPPKVLFCRGTGYASS